MRNFFSKFFCPHFIDLEISLFCKQTGLRYVNKWLKQISLTFLYSPWIVETPELCYKKWPDFYLKLSRSISVNALVLLKIIFLFLNDSLLISNGMWIDGHHVRIFLKHILGNSLLIQYIYFVLQKMWIRKYFITTSKWNNLE